MSELTCPAPDSPLSTTGWGRRTDANSLRTKPRISPSTSLADAAPSSAGRLALMTFMLVPVRLRVERTRLCHPLHVRSCRGISPHDGRYWARAGHSADVKPGDVVCL